MTQQSLSPQDIATFSSRRNLARRQFTSGLSELGYRRDQLGIDRTLAERSFTRQINRSRERLPGSFVGRGLLNSGLFRNSLKRFYIDANDAYTRLQLGFQRKFDQLDFAQGGLEDRLAMALAQINSDEQARRTALASVIQEVL